MEPLVESPLNLGPIFWIMENTDERCEASKNRHQHHISEKLVTIGTSRNIESSSDVAQYSTWPYCVGTNHWKKFTHKVKVTNLSLIPTKMDPTSEINIKQEKWSHETSNARKSLELQEDECLDDHYGLYPLSQKEPVERGTERWAQRGQTICWKTKVESCQKHKGVMRSRESKK